MVRGRKKVLKCGLCLAACMLTYLPLSEAAMVTVTGQGSSERAAVKAALRQAIEQQIGVMVDSRSYVTNYKLIHDRVYTQSDRRSTAYILSKYRWMCRSKSLAQPWGHWHRKRPLLA